MANKLTTKKPLFGNKRSHAENATRTKQNPNYQTKRINGVKITLAASEWKTLKKNAE